jgi:hypothetical protein
MFSLIASVCYRKLCIETNGCFVELLIYNSCFPICIDLRISRKISVLLKTCFCQIMSALHLYKANSIQVRHIAKQQQHYIQL